MGCNSTPVPSPPNKLRELLSSLFKKGHAQPPQQVLPHSAPCSRRSSPGSSQSAAGSPAAIGAAALLCAEHARHGPASAAVLVTTLLPPPAAAAAASFGSKLCKAGSKCSLDAAAAAAAADAAADTCSQDIARRDAGAGCGSGETPLLQLVAPAVGRHGGGSAPDQSDCSSSSSSSDASRSSLGSAAITTPQVQRVEPAPVAPDAAAAAAVPLRCLPGPMGSQGKVCASVDDMYRQLFGDVPQPAAAAAAAGGGGCPFTRQGSACSMASAGSSLPFKQLMPAGPSCDFTADDQPQQQQRLGGGGTTYSNSSAAAAAAAAAAEEAMLSGGLAKLRIRSRLSGSDGSGSGFFLDESPTCSSSWGPSWALPPHPAAAAAADGGGSSSSARGSPWYSQQQQLGVTSTPGGSSAAAAAGSRARPPSRPRCWERQQHGSVLDSRPGSSGASSCGGQAAGSGGRFACRSAAASPAGSDGPGRPPGGLFSAGVWRTRSVPNAPSGLAAALASGAAGTRPAAAAAAAVSAAASESASASSCCDTPLAHSYSTPDLGAAAAGSGSGATAAAAAAPACARSLFGSVAQQLPDRQDRLLLLGGSGGSGGSSAGWQQAQRTDSGLLLDDQLLLLPALSALGGVGVSVGDELIREVNADNVCSAAWGPPAAAAKLAAFKYCAATSPLSHPGRGSPFSRGGAAGCSPFGSPRGNHSGAELPSHRSGPAPASCPGSPLGRLYSGSGSGCYSSDDAQLQQQQLRHRYPFGRCSLEQGGANGGGGVNGSSSGYSYRPSPLQQRQQQQQCGEELAARVERRLRGSSGSGLITPEPPGHNESDAPAAAAAAARGLGGQDCHQPQQQQQQQPLLSTRSGPCSVRFNVPADDDEQQQQEEEEEEERVSATRRASFDRQQQARRSPAPAAAVGALLVGWASPAAGRQASEQQQPGGAVSASSGSSISNSSSSGSSYCQGRQAAAAAGSRGRPAAVPRLVLKMSGGSADSSVDSSTACLAEAEPGIDDSVVAQQQQQRPSLDDAFGPNRSALCSAYAAAAAAAVAAEQGGGRCLRGSLAGPSLSAPGCSSSSDAIGSSSNPASEPGLPAVQCLSDPGASAAGGGFAAAAAAGWQQPCGGWSGSSTVPVDAELLSKAGSPLSPSKHSKLRRQGSRLGSATIGTPSRLSNNSAAAAQAAATGAPSPGGSIGRSNSSSSGSSAVLALDHRARVAAGLPPLAGTPSLSRRGDCNPQQHPHQAGQEHCRLMAAGSLAVSPNAAGAAAQASCLAAARAGRCQPAAADTDAAEAGQQAACDTAAAEAAAADLASAADGATLGGLPSLPEVDFIQRVGRGSFGDVYRGVWCGSLVAVKVISVRQHHTRLPPAALPHAGSDGCGSSSDGQQQQQQQRQGEEDAHAQQVALELAQHEYESWLNANLRHPNIVQLFTSFTVALEERAPPGSSGPLLGAGGSSSSGGGGGLSWKTHLVMEYCEAGTMQEVLQRGLFMDPACPGCCQPMWVLATAKELCVAVAYLHSMDVVHGDLKSSNVLLKAAAATAWDTRGFVAKVSDFGLSRVLGAINAASGGSGSDGGGCGSSGDGDGSPLGQLGSGSPRFGALSHAAPELIRGKALSKASDVYSVGVLLWELVTGQAPFYGLHPGQLLSLKLSLPTSQLLPFPDTTPPELVRLCLDCWAEAPGARPGMAAVVERLNSLALVLFGEEAALMMFPDLAGSLTAQRRAAAAAALTAAAGASGSRA